VIDSQRETFHKSEGSLNDLATALVKVQAKLEPVKREHTGQIGNRKYQYAALEDVLKACRDLLTENGLAILQLPGEVTDDGVEVTTLLVHTSGQYVGSTLRMPCTNGDAQSVGSAITYARRYQVQSIVGLAAEEDDDGSAASSAGHSRSGSSGSAPPKRGGNGSQPDQATTDMLAAIEELLPLPTDRMKAVRAWCEAKGKDAPVSPADIGRLKAEDLASFLDDYRESQEAP